MARSLAERFPSLRLTVQIDDVQPAPLSQETPWLGGTTGLAQVAPDPSHADNNDNSCSSSSTGNVNVTYRSAGVPQHVKDAAVYILHLPSASPRSELQGYLDLLRNSGGIMLVLTARLLPEPGSLCGPEVEAVARARDLCMLQLAGEGEMELAEVLGMIGAVRDSAGRLVVTSHLRSHNNLIVALVVKHQAS